MVSAGDGSDDGAGLAAHVPLLAQLVGATMIPAGVAALTSVAAGVIVAGIELVVWGTLAEIVEDQPVEVEA